MKACSRYNEQTELLNSLNNEFHSNAGQKKGAHQRRKVRSDEPSKQTRTEESDQISSEGPRTKTEVQTQLA
jgi:hypothetical protein